MGILIYIMLSVVTWHSIGFRKKQSKGTVLTIQRIQSQFITLTLQHSIYVSLREQTKLQSRTPGGWSWCGENLQAQRYNLECKNLPFLFFTATAIFTFCLSCNDPHQTIAKLPRMSNKKWLHILKRLVSTHHSCETLITMTKKFIQCYLLWINPTVLHFLCQLFL